jgi:hypothetical protein
MLVCDFRHIRCFTTSLFLAPQDKITGGTQGVEQWAPPMSRRPVFRTGPPSTPQRTRWSLGGLTMVVVDAALIALPRPRARSLQAKTRGDDMCANSVYAHTISHFSGRGASALCINACRTVRHGPAAGWRSQSPTLRYPYSGALHNLTEWLGTFGPIRAYHRRQPIHSGEVFDVFSPFDFRRTGHRLILPRNGGRSCLDEPRSGAR